MYRFTPVLVVLVLVTACATKITPSPVVSPVIPEPTASPLVATPTITPLVLPTPEEGKGNVHGWLSPGSLPLSLLETELYLGDIFSSDDGSFSVYYFDRTVHPKARWIDAISGEFLFENVKPGEYALILWWDVSGYVAVHNALTGKDIKVEVVPGQITELGLLVHGH